MSDTTPPAETGNHDAHAARLAALEKGLADLHDEARDSRDHRTQMRAYLGLVAALGLAVLIGAFSARDVTMTTSGRVDAVSARLDRVEAAASRKDSDDRTTREAIVRLQTTLETLQSTVVTRLDSIEQHLPRTVVR